MATTKKVSTTIPVAQAQFLSSNETNWDELFDGYDDIKIITFSSGFAFASSVICKFKTAEIIFGCDEILNGGFASVLAYQQAFLKALRLDMPTYEALTKRVEDGSLHLWVAHDETSHEKIYLLSSEDGRKRVITGSANLSKSAFEGYQRENIICFDEDEKAYNYFLSRYELLRQYSVDEVTKKVLVANPSTEGDRAEDDEDIMDLPVCNTVVKTQEAIVLDGPTDKTDFKTRFALILDKDNDELKAITRKMKAKPVKRGGLVRVEPEFIRAARAEINRRRKEIKEQMLAKPELVINYDEKSININGEEQDLNPSTEEITRDVNAFVEFMDGYRTNFTGDTATLQNKYYAFANWFLCSPFMAKLRDAAINNGRKVDRFPVYGMLYGKSGGGKTTLMEVLYHMMMGVNAKSVVWSANKFTQSELIKMKLAFHGAPLLVDDITDDRIYRHLLPAVKDDTFGNDVIGLDNYPAVALTANASVNGLKGELTKRMVCAYVDVGSPSASGNDIEAKFCKNSGTALYREYARRMLDEVLSIVEELDNPEENNFVSPDVLGKSSQVLYDIFAEYYDGEMPSYIQVLTWDNYSGKSARAASSINDIRDAWMRRNDSFEVDIQRDQVLFHTGNEELAQKLKDELDVFLNISRYDDNVLISHLDVAGDVLGIDFLAPIITKLVRDMLSDEKSSTAKLNWRRDTCTLKFDDEATSDAVQRELALVGYEVEQNGTCLVVTGIDKLAAYCGAELKKSFLDSLVSIF